MSKSRAAGVSKPSLRAKRCNPAFCADGKKAGLLRRCAPRNDDVWTCVWISRRVAPEALNRQEEYFPLKGLDKRAGPVCGDLPDGQNDWPAPDPASPGIAACDAKFSLCSC